MKIPWSQLEDAIEQEMYGTDNPGFCLSCGNEQEGCEPDARRDKCEECGKRSVYGAEEINAMGEVDFDK